MSARDDGGPAFPVEVDNTQPEGRQTGNTVYQTYGMSTRTYAAIQFAAAWTAALGTSNMVETRDERAIEANRLGLLQADDMLKARQQ